MASKRKALSKRTRFEVFKRDKFQCQYCGRTPPTVTLEIDHILAFANGGSDDEPNLVTSCRDCNSGKSDRPLKEAPLPLAAQMEVQRERAEQIEAYNRFLMEDRDRREAVVEEIGRHWYNLIGPEKDKDKWVFGSHRSQSIKTFLKHLPAAEIIEAIDVTDARYTLKYYDGESGDRAWKYFCGICWRKIRRRNGEED